MEFSYSQTENFDMEKLSSDTGYFKKPVEINMGWKCLGVLLIKTVYCSRLYSKQNQSSLYLLQIFAIAIVDKVKTLVINMSTTTSQCTFWRKATAYKKGFRNIR